MEQTSSISSRSLSVGRLRVLSSIARLWLLNRWLACLSLSGSSILVLKLTFSPDPFPRNLLLSNGLILRFFIQHVYGSLLALKTLVSQIKPAQLAFGRTLI